MTRLSNNNDYCNTDYFWKVVATVFVVGATFQRLRGKSFWLWESTIYKEKD